MEISARGDMFKVARVTGNLFVCAEQNGGCCCGHTEKGRAAVNKDLYERLWEEHRLRNKVHLSFVGCLGPCPVGNNAMIQMFGRSIWLKDLNADRLIPLIFDYIDVMLAAGQFVPAEGELAGHIYERYLSGDAADASSTAADLDGLDPVCMMAVDPATAKWQSEFNGKTYYFCAPSCKRSFDRAPSNYVSIPGAASASSEFTQGVQIMSNQNQQSAETKTFSVPNISCSHCVRSIQNEVAELAGVVSVQADEKTKVVTVAWDKPATWDQIKATLVEIDYPPQELIQL
jgi:cobaltochelatase CobN